MKYNQRSHKTANLGFRSNNFGATLRPRPSRMGALQKSPPLFTREKTSFVQSDAANDDFSQVKFHRSRR